MIGIKTTFRKNRNADTRQKKVHCTNCVVYDLVRSEGDKNESKRSVYNTKLIDFENNSVLPQYIFILLHFVPVFTTKKKNYFGHNISVGRSPSGGPFLHNRLNKHIMRNRNKRCINII